jgi:hypothetical protein
VAHFGTKLDKSNYTSQMTEFRPINKYNKAERFLLGTAVAALVLVIVISTGALF